MKHNKEMIVLVIGFLFLILISSNSISAIQPSQQYAKIFLNPFYRQSMASNTNFTYTLEVFTPDKIGQVYSAIIAIDIYLTPTVNYDLWVNGKSCNNPRYTVSTTYAGASQGRLYFDCSNVITGEGFYNVTIRADKNSGASVSWLDITYSNRPRGTMEVGATEYTNSQIAKAWLQLIDADGDYIDDGVCYVDIYTPDNQILLERATMLSLNHDGIYYYDYSLTDLVEGVYPVIARCYYTALVNYYNVTSYLVTRGTYDTGTVADTQTVNDVRLKFEEQATNPTRNITVQFNMTSGICAGIDEALLSGITIRTVTKFDSVVNDDVTLSIFNYTANAWQDLPNKVLEGNAYRDVSNTLLFTNITKAGYSTATQPVRIQFRDTMNLADTATNKMEIDYLQVGCNQLANPEWQEVKGSSEFHVSIPAGTEQYVAESLCGEDSQNGFLSICSEFRNNLSYANFTWGYIYDKVTFYNSYNTDIDQIESYRTSLGQDCTGIIDITETRNGVTVSIKDNVTLSQGDKDNCILSLPVIFNETENDFYVEITQENYMEWETHRINDLINYYRLPIESFCNNVETQHGITYDIPITGANDVSSLYASNPILLGCYRSIDDLYWFDYYYDTSQTINTTGAFESYLYNIQFYYEELKDGADAVSSITGQDVLVHVNTLCGESSQYPNQYSCAKIMPPDAYFSSQEGYIFQNLTVINDFNTTSNLYYSYSTAPYIDCSAIMEIIKDNGTRTDIIEDVLFNSGTDGSCDMNIPINNVEGIPSYQIELYIENYLLWDIYWARDNVNGWNDSITPFCNNVSINRSIDYILPINQSIEAYRNDSEFYFCYRAMDDVYWWYYFYDQLVISNFTMIGEIGSYRYESEFFWKRILDDYNTVKTYQRNINQIQTLQDILDLRDNTANRVWEYTDRNLTYYQDITNYTLIQQMVWNATTRSLTELNLTVNVNATAIAEAVWSSVNRTLTDYNQSDLTNYNLIQQVVWNATIRTLTDFNLTVNATINDSAVAGAVWGYTNKTVDFATTGNTDNVSLVDNIKNMGQTYVGGTEYIYGDAGKVVIRLVRGTGSLALIENGATCTVSIAYPNSTAYITNASMAELGNGVYYYDFTVPGILGIYPYYTDCNISDRFYYGLDDFHVFETNFSTIPSTVWNYDAGRNLTYYQVANLTNVTVNINGTAVAQDVWAYNGTVNSNLLSQFAEYTWTVFNNVHDFITGIWSAPSRTLTTSDSDNCRYLEYGYYNKDLPMLSNVNCN